MSVIKVIPLCYLIRPNAKTSLHYDFGRENPTEIEANHRFYDWSEDIWSA